MSGAKRAIRYFVSAVALFAVGALLDPLGPRYEFRTARQWLSFYSQTRRLPEREVVAHFSAKAIPMLVSESRPSGLYRVSVSLEGLLRRPFFQSVRDDDFDRRLACHDWARMLLAQYPNAYVEALASNSDVSHGLELTRLFFGDRQLGPTLKLYSRQTTNQMLQAKAEQLLDAYRALN